MYLLVTVEHDHTHRRMPSAFEWVTADVVSRQVDAQAIAQRVVVRNHRSLDVCESCVELRCCFCGLGANLVPVDQCRLTVPDDFTVTEHLEW